MNVPPYGAAITEAIASGDLEKLKAAQKAGEDYMATYGDIPSTLDILRVEIAKAEAEAGQS